MIFQIRLCHDVLINQLSLVFLSKLFACVALTFLSLSKLIVNLIVTFVSFLESVFSVAQPFWVPGLALLIVQES